MRETIIKSSNLAYRKAGVKCVLTLGMIYFIFFNSNLFPQPDASKDLVKTKITLSNESVVAGSEVKVSVTVSMDDGWHINSNKPNEDYLIPTVLKIGQANKKIELTSIIYPKAKELKFDFSEKPVSVYERDITITGLLKIPMDAIAGKYKILFVLNYQACNNSTCLPPNFVQENILLNIIAGKAEVTETKIDSGKQIQSAGTSPKIIEEPKEKSLEYDLASNGLFLSLLIVFLGGLALNLTPCVYPLIPITIGYFGGQSEGSTGKLFLLGVLYVLGMSVTYSIIGVVTALSGAVFGTLLQNTFVIFGIAAVLVALSLSMFGLYEFKLPDSLVAKAGGAKGGYLGSIFMGLTMGIVAAPCIGPFVLGLVTYVGAKGDPYYGFLMFFFLALGLGTPYIFLALFSGKIKNLPRAGFWMDAIKHIFGFILLGMALYFLQPILPKNIANYILPVFMILASLYILLFDKSARKVKGFKYFNYAFSLIVVGIAIYLLIPKEEKSPEWKIYSDNFYQTSLAKNQPMIIDFYADWCIPCKELDAITFSDSKVIDEFKRFDAFKVDMTKSLSDETERIRKMFNVIGMPTVLVINSNGKEVERITGFIKAEEFLNKIKSVN
ncbi:MAG: thioredoxin domain-containing protein [Ignavibacteriales bacterium]|nr:thioredoxin domain-containing protein [Ignavibacteriales bacterium]